MDINATLIGQMITFAILVFFIMKYVWPPVIQAIQSREDKISAGLAAAERGQRELALAHEQFQQIVREAKQEASHILEQANLHSARLIEDAKVQAKEENARIIHLAQNEIDRELAKTRESLKSQFATLAVAGAEKILQKKLDASDQVHLLNQLISEI